MDLNNSNITISSNLISQNGPGQAPFFASGIEIDVSSANNTIFNNTINNNYDSGIAFRDIESSGSTSSNTTVTNNTISNNGYYGITLQYNGNNTITYNIISSQQSYEGIGIISSDYNTIYLNSFIDNYANPSQISEDPALTNYFDNGYFGNYYNNYNGTDSNNDGIGDTNYTLSTSMNNDTLPLMHPAYLHVNQPNNKVISEGATSQQLTWLVNGYDAITYSVTLNQTVSTSGTIDTSNWSKSVQTSLDGLSLGSYIVTLSVSDLNTSLTFKITTIVSVVDTTAPVVTVSTSTLSYVAGTTGHSISVNATDLHPDSYSVYKDGNQFALGAWNTSADITVSVDGLAVGTYDFTITAFDSSNNSANVSVIITVTSAPDTNSSATETGSSTSTSTGNNAPSFEALTTLLGLGAVFGYETKKRRK